MIEEINPKLLDYILCPDCLSNLLNRRDYLKCSQCNQHYKIVQGIPFLLPKTFDTTHMHEEVNLAKMMKRPKTNPNDHFKAQQWNFFKEEFWNIVKENTGKPPKSFINIGCGYDHHFTQFEHSENVFINFDLVPEMLCSLKNDHNAQFCVGGDIQKLPFKKSVFDYIICTDVIHHEYGNIFSLLNSFYELLKPGGILFLTDPNAWGLYQFPKSILLPNKVHKALREIFHKIKKSTHRPAEYEFPTNFLTTRKILKSLGFSDITFYPNHAYPNIRKISYTFYLYFSKFEWIKKYHNFHYVLSAIK